MKNSELEKIKKFLIENNRQISLPHKLRDMNGLIKNEKANICCETKTMGSNPFSVLLLLFDNNRPVWTMSYYGYLLTLDHEKNGKRIKDIINFVNQACHRPLENNIPLVGCEFWRDGNFSYLRNIYGSFVRFNGDCKVMDVNIKVFEGRFQGGIVEQ